MLYTIRAMLGEKNAKIVVLEDQLAEASKVTQKLTAEVETARMNGASNLNELTAKLSASQREAESFRSEINQIAAALATVRDELKRAEKGAAKASTESAKVVYCVYYYVYY
jgi:chromosome segregation ATPase